jgi:hypothetical protein
LPVHEPTGESNASADNGKNVQASIVDKCYLCGQNDIDMSPALFEQFADTSVGRLYGVSWWYN